LNRLAFRLPIISGIRAFSCNKKRNKPRFVADARGEANDVIRVDPRPIVIYQAWTWAYRMNPEHCLETNVAHGQIILVGGGTRSGKSDFALSVARSLGTRRLFVATAQAGDDEMRERIGRHRSTRGSDFQTVEEPIAVVDVFRQIQDHDVVVLDCLTLWLANLLMGGNEPEMVLRRVEEFAAVLAQRSAHALIVTSEVGLGLVPETPLGRTFRDVTGMAHQRLASLADQVYFGVLGVMLRLKPGPIVVV
jgi:adenosylcobinamide kinase / adenosylcobinamide-phosphate guanylyltransferase